MINYLHPVAHTSTTDLLARTYPQIKRDFGSLAEPFTLHAPAPQLLAGTWMALRETELTGHVRRELKEAVAATVSRLNRCPYCTDAHTMLLHATSAHDVAAAISHGRDDQAQDAEIRQIIAWANATRTPGDLLLQRPPFAEADAPEIIGTAVAFHVHQPHGGHLSG